MGRPSKSITPASVSISTIKAQRKNQHCVFCFPMYVYGLFCLPLGQLGFPTPDLLSSPSPTLPSLAPDSRDAPMFPSMSTHRWRPQGGSGLASPPVRRDSSTYSEWRGFELLRACSRRKSFRLASRLGCWSTHNTATCAITWEEETTKTVRDDSCGMEKTGRQYIVTWKNHGQ